MREVYVFDRKGIEEFIKDKIEKTFVLIFQKQIRSL